MPRLVTYGTLWLPVHLHDIPVTPMSKSTSSTLCRRCTADGVYLQPLADKFARLVLQLLARYTFWVADGIAAKGSGGAGAPAQDGPASAQVLGDYSVALTLSMPGCNL